jgi:hypothetical protein
MGSIRVRIAGSAALASTDDDLIDIAGLRREGLLQQILGPLRLGSAQRELVGGTRPDAGRHRQRRDDHDQPDDQNPGSVTDAPARHAGHETRFRGHSSPAGRLPAVGWGLWQRPDLSRCLDVQEDAFLELLEGLDLGAH